MRIRRTLRSDGVLICALALLTSTYAYSFPADILDVPFLFRIDTRGPAEVFGNGFSAPGSQRSLLAHVLDGSCDAHTQADRSAWVSTSASRLAATSYIRTQLSTQHVTQADGSVGLWLYAVRPDNTAVRVRNVWQRAIVDGSHSRNGYTPQQAALLSSLAGSSTLMWSQEVVMPRIPPQSIWYAQLITATTEGPVIDNPNAQQAPLNWQDTHADLHVLIPPANITRFQAPSTNQQTCALACDGATTSHRSRTARAASISAGLNCQMPSQAAQALMSGEE